MTREEKIRASVLVLRFVSLASCFGCEWAI